MIGWRRRALACALALCACVCGGVQDSVHLTVSVVRERKPASPASVQSDPPIRTGIDPHLSKISDRLLECTFAVMLPQIRTMVRWKALEHSF